MQFHPQYAETVEKLEVALNSPKLMVFGRCNTWLENGALPEEILDVCTRVAKQGRWNGSTLNYFDGFIADAIAARTKPMPAPNQTATRFDSAGTRKRTSGEYEPPPQLDAAGQDRIDRMKADMLNKGINVMTVTYHDAKRMFERGWLNEQAAERLGVR